eukprot:NODE_248_length_12985_cov_0.286357.p12 type:complete len:107 gc:universal NODE_248_length_12985_cov_0.286357:9219-8899(-)
MYILKNMYSKIEKETTEGKRSEILQNVWAMEKTMAAKQEADARTKEVAYNMERASAAMKQADVASKRAEYEQSWKAWFAYAGNCWTIDSSIDRSLGSIQNIRVSKF